MTCDFPNDYSQGYYKDNFILEITNKRKLGADKHIAYLRGQQPATTRYLQGDFISKAKCNKLMITNKKLQIGGPKF